MNRARSWLPSRYGAKRPRSGQSKKLHVDLLETREVPAGIALDFDTNSSPTAPGYTGVKPIEYTPAAGLGWESLNDIRGRARPGSNNLTRDFHFGTEGTFLADLPNGVYDVCIKLGDPNAARDRVSVWVEGQSWLTNFTTKAGQVAEVRGRVTVTDGQLSVRLADGGGSSPRFAIGSLVATLVDPATLNLWPGAAAPTARVSVVTNAREVGIKFQATADGYVNGIRFYKAKANTGTHVGTLWAADGTQLAIATFTNETASGWQEVYFANPVAVTANQTYMASYLAPRGRYSVTNNYFLPSGVSSGLLKVLPADQGGGGFYKSGAGFPNLSFKSSNYWVDVVYTTDLTPPTVTGVNPANGAAGVSTLTDVRVTFSETMNQATITSLSVELRTSAGVNVPAVVTYDPTTRVAILTPAAALAANNSYTVRVNGGTGIDVVRDVAGNALAADFTSTFGTAAGPSANAGADKTSNEAVSVSFTGASSGGAAPLTYQWDFGDGGSASGTLTPSHTFIDNGTYSVRLTVTDANNNTATDTATVTVNNVNPTASLSNNGPVNTNANVTISFANQNDVSSIDRTAGYRYSYDFNNDGTWDQTDVASATATTSFSSVGSKTVKARIKDKDGGFTDFTTTVNVTNSGDETYNGLTIPRTHVRLWFTPDRLAQARQYYATHPFTPRSDDPQANALRFLMTGETSYAQVAINALMSFTVSDVELNAVASNAYRWGDWVPVVYDWLYDQLTPTQRSTFMARYNHYVDVFSQKDWGGPGHEANNYYWGYFRNEFNWAIATFYENPMARGFLDHVLNTRWRDSFLPWAAARGAGGVLQEGTEYGANMLGYMIIPLQSAALMGRDLWSETNFYKEAAAYLLYATSPGPVYNEAGTGQFHQLFPFNDDENSRGFPSAADLEVSYPPFMSLVAQRFDGTPLGGYARQWLANVGGVPWHVAALDPGGSSQPLSGLPLDFYAPGPGYLYAHSNWSAPATSINFQLGGLTGVGHDHRDRGSFQMLRGGRWLSRESTGYVGQITGYNGVGTASVTSTLAHNGLVFNGQGLVDAFANGRPNVTRVESRPDYTFASVNLTPAYRTDNDPWAGAYDNKYVKSVVRDFIYVRALDTLLVFDRTESNSLLMPAANVPKTFLLHFPNAPTVQGNTVLGVNGNQALRLTALTPTNQSASTFRVVDERTGTPNNTIDYQFRLEESTSGQAQSYLINVLQARGINDANVTATMTEDATTFIITLTHPTLGTSVIKLNKGMASSGGEFGYSATGTPTNFRALRAGVEGILVSEGGVVWEGSGPPALQFSTATIRASEGTSAVVTVIRQGNSSVPVTVQYATSNGTAAAGSDYTSASGTLSFAAGESSKSFTVPLLGDSLDEGDETVNLTLSNPTGGASLGSPATAVLTIANAAPQDGESPTATVTSPANNATVSGTITLTATATDNVGVAGVRFYVDGVAVGSEDTSAPYSISWDSSTVGNGTHVITARARDAAGNVGISPDGTVTTSNTNNRLVAAFGFNEGSGTTANSGVGGITGTLSGATWSTAGRFGGALSFDGIDDWVTVADSAALDLTTGMTLEAWVRPSAINGWETVIMKEATGNLAYTLYADNNGNDAGDPRRPTVEIRQGSTTSAAPGTAQLTLNTWAHLAATYDGSSLKMYVNGTLASSLDVTGSINVTSGVLRIGGNSIWGEFFNGLIDEVRIYSRALTQSEIQTDMTTPV